MIYWLLLAYALGTVMGWFMAKRFWTPITMVVSSVLKKDQWIDKL